MLTPEMYFRITQMLPERSRASARESRYGSKCIYSLGSSLDLWKQQNMYGQTSHVGGQGKCRHMRVVSEEACAHVVDMVVHMSIHIPTDMPLACAKQMFVSMSLCMRMLHTFVETSVSAS